MQQVLRQCSEMNKWDNFNFKKLREIKEIMGNLRRNFGSPRNQFEVLIRNLCGGLFSSLTV